MRWLVTKGGHRLVILLGLNLLLAASVSAAPHVKRVTPAPRPPATSPGGARMTPADGGETVSDNTLKVTWLADANLAAKEKFGVPNINPDGSMDYATAVAWVEAMNKFNHGAGYLGHANWTLPAAPSVDKGCGSHKINSFGFNCTLSAMGSLYYSALGLHWPASAVPSQSNQVGPFKNFQPNLYWTAEQSAKNKKGYTTFWFNSGFQGSNVDQNYFYVLPMIAGKLAGTPAAVGKGLQVNPGGETIYDPVADVTWLADANLAATQKFGVPAKGRDGVANFSPNGGMTHTAALVWIKAVNAGKGYLGHTNWELPPVPTKTKTSCANGNFGFGCKDSPFGELFYGQFHLSQGQPVTPIPDIKVGALHNIQPSLYWGCQGDAGQTTCSTTKPAPAPGFGWSFNFGDGFQGTDVVANNLYVMAYYPNSPSGTPTPKPVHTPPTPRSPCGTRCK